MSGSLEEILAAENSDSPKVNDDGVDGNTTVIKDILGDEIDEIEEIIPPIGTKASSSVPVNNSIGCPETDIANTHNL